MPESFFAVGFQLNEKAQMPQFPGPYNGEGNYASCIGLMKNSEHGIVDTRITIGCHVAGDEDRLGKIQEAAQHIMESSHEQVQILTYLILKPAS